METARAPDILHARSELLVSCVRTVLILYLFLLLQHTRDERLRRPWLVWGRGAADGEAE